MYLYICAEYIIFLLILLFQLTKGALTEAVLDGSVFAPVVKKQVKHRLNFI